MRSSTLRRGLVAGLLTVVAGSGLSTADAATTPFLPAPTGSHPVGTTGVPPSPRRIAMVGMSLGGASVGETMLTDRRVRAGANLDGRMFKPLPESGLSRPFLLLGAPGPEDTWDTNWTRLTGWKRWLTVTGAVHASFADYDMVAQQIGVDLGSELPGTRSVAITRDYVRAFVDRHLVGTPQPLLERPSTRYPEVGFRS